VINYRRQDGCHNCKNVFIRMDWEEDNRYYCLLNAPKRPKCGAGAMHNEMFDIRDEKKYDKQLDAWDLWSDKTEVHTWGTCDRFKNKL